MSNGGSLYLTISEQVFDRAAERPGEVCDQWAHLGSCIYEPSGWIDAMLYFLGPLAGVLTVPVLYALAASPAFAMFLVLLAQDVRALGLGMESVSIGGIDITFLDIVYALLFLSLIVRLLHKGRLTRLELAWFAFGALGVVAFMRGLSKYGLTFAGDVRPTFYFTTAILYFASVAGDRRFLNRVATLWIANGVFLALFALFLIATQGFLAFSNEVSGLNRRILHASFAFQILQGAIISLYLWNTPDRSSPWRYVGFFLIPVVILMQYRTVWVTAIFVVFFIAIYDKRVRGRLLSGMAIFALFAAITALALYADTLDPVAGSFAAVTVEAFGADSTFVWRILGWEALWNSYSFDIDSLIGPPAGTGRNLIHQNFIYAHTHSQYLLLLLRNGLFGLVLMMGTYYVVLRRLCRPPPQQPGEMLSPRLLHILLASQLVFFISYNVTYEQFALLGTAIGYLAYSRSAALARPEALPEGTWSPMRQALMAGNRA